MTAVNNDKKVGTHNAHAADNKNHHASWLQCRTIDHKELTQTDPAYIILLARGIKSTWQLTRGLLWSEL